MRKKLNLKTPSTFPPFFSGSTLLLIFFTSSPRVVQGNREWGLWSVHHMLSLLLLPPQGRIPHTPPLLLCGIPPMGDSPPRTASMWVPPTGCNSPQTAPVWVSHGLTSPVSKPAPAWAPLSTGLQVLPGACSSVGFPWGHSLLQASSAPEWGPPRARGGYLLHLGPPWAAGGQSATPWFSPHAEGNLCCGVCSNSSPLLLHWPCCLQSCFSHIFSLHSPSAGFFSPLKHVVLEALLPSLMGSALASSRSLLELAGIGYIM